MATNYIWDIISMVSYTEYQGQNDVVCIVYWQTAGVDGQYTAYYDGNTELTYQSGTPFTPYDQLTKDQVVGWVKASLGTGGVSAVEANIQTQLDGMTNPPVVLLPLPWSQS